MHFLVGEWFSEHCTFHHLTSDSSLLVEDFPNFKRFFVVEQKPGLTSFVLGREREEEPTSTEALSPGFHGNYIASQ